MPDLESHRQGNSDDDYSYGILYYYENLAECLFAVVSESSFSDIQRGESDRNYCWNYAACKSYQ